MGVGPGSRSSSRVPRRAWYPSGPWIDGIRPAESTASELPEKKKRSKKSPKLPNPDPDNYKVTKAHEEGGYLIVMINYPDCVNFEGNKILVFFEVTLIDLVNQKLIDPHFFPSDEKYKSPVARFVPTDEGWEMAKTFVQAMISKRGK